MSDFEAGDKRGSWLKALDREAKKLARGQVTTRRELRALRDLGWVNGRREAKEKR